MSMAQRTVRRTVLAGIAALTIGFSTLGVLGVAQAEAPQQPSATSAKYGGKITRQEVMTRARTWLGKVWYSQQKCYPSGVPWCEVPNYRTDCSGYVSMAWKLPFSRYTGNLRDVMHRIPYRNLKAGDVLFRRDSSVQHVALFVRWAGNGDAVVWEEYSSGHKAEQRVWDKLKIGTYTPYRYNNIVDGTQPKPTKPKPTKPKPTATSPTAPRSPSEPPASPEPPTTAPTSSGPELPVTGSSLPLFGGFGGSMVVLGIGLLLWATRQRYRGVRRRTS